MNPPRFDLPRAMRDEIIAHAAAESPRECCGLISGSRGKVVQLYRLTNLAAGNSLYEIDPRQLYHLEFHELPDQGTDVLAIYHSHPISPAYPSATDLSLAFWPDAYYLICSLADAASSEVRAFKLVDGVATEVEIVVGD